MSLSTSLPGWFALNMDPFIMATHLFLLSPKNSVTCVNFYSDRYKVIK